MADPDNMNETRAQTAAIAVAAFGAAVFCYPDSEDDETHLGDLLCNLRHWADRQGVDFAAMIERSAMNYEAETTPND